VALNWRPEGWYFDIKSEYIGPSQSCITLVLILLSSSSSLYNIYYYHIVIYANRRPSDDWQPYGQNIGRGPKSFRSRHFVRRAWNSFLLFIDLLPSIFISVRARALFLRNGSTRPRAPRCAETPARRRAAKANDTGDARSQVHTVVDSPGYIYITIINK